MKALWIMWAVVVCAVTSASAQSRPFSGPRDVPDTFFGTTTHWNGDWTIPTMRDMGITTSRIDFVHKGLEPAWGTYDFSEGNWMIKSADLSLKEGVDLLGVITAYGEYDQAPEKSQAFEKFAFELASKYRGKIRYWEVGNEPDMTVNGKGYVALLKALYTGIKRADPANKVVLAGFSGNEAGNFELLYRLGGKNYFDIVNSHSYTRPRSPEEGGYVHLIKSLYRVMQKYGDNKPCWVTEIGWNGMEPSMMAYLSEQGKKAAFVEYVGTEEDEARYLARAYLWSASMPWIERVYFFHLAVDPPMTTVPLNNEGVFNVDDYINVHIAYADGKVAPKLGYYSLKTVFGVLKGARYIESIDLGKRIFAMVFTRGDAAMTAIWSLDDGILLPLEDVSMIRNITTMVGTPSVVRRTLEISGRPIYLTTSSADVNRLKQQLIKAKPVGLQSFSLALGLDIEKSTATQPVAQLTVTNNSATAQETPSLKIDVQPPWTVVSPIKKGESPFSGSETRSHSVALSKTATTACAENVLEMSARVVDAKPVNCVQNSVRYVVVPMWPIKSEPISLGLVPQQREMSSWKNAEDCTATWQCAWDARNLYLIVDVNDDVHAQSCTKAPNVAHPSGNIWQGDSVQIAIDLACDAKPCSNVPQYDGVNDVEFGMALAADGTIFCTWANPNGELGVMLLDSLKITRDEKAKTTRYEATIPWTTFGVTSPMNPRWMGFNIVVNDDDGAGGKGSLQWTPGITRSKDPSRYNKILLAPNVN